MAPHKIQPDPSTFVAYSHAAAGHDGVRSDPTGTIIAKPCTASEVSFYESATTHPAFQAYMPTFIGTLTSNEEGKLSTTVAPTPVIENDLQNGEAEAWVPSGGKKLHTGISIVLENVTAGFTKPNVIDLKLGARLWSEDAPEEKRKKLDQVSDATTSRSLGFRIAGMRVHRPGRKGKPEGRFPEHIEVEDDGYWSYGKKYGREFNAEDVHEGFVEFFGGEDSLKKSGRKKLVAERLAGKVSNLASVLEKEESRMYSASILLVYEGDEEALDEALDEENRRKSTGRQDPAAIEEQNEDEEQEEGEEEGEEEDEEDEEVPKVVEVRLIDFAHAKWTPGQGKDENSLQGVRSVVEILQKLITENEI